MREHKRYQNAGYIISLFLLPSYRVFVTLWASRIYFGIVPLALVQSRQAGDVGDAETASGHGHVVPYFSFTAHYAWNDGEVLLSYSVCCFFDTKEVSPSAHPCCQLPPSHSPHFTIPKR